VRLYLLKISKVYNEIAIAKIIIALLLILCAVPVKALAAVGESNTISMEGASGQVLTEASTQQVLIEYEADTARSVAGLSKLPGLLVLCEAVDSGMFDLTSLVQVSQEAARISGPTAFIEGGEAIEAAPLMKAAVMVCAGDAIYALGEALFGSEAVFVSVIQERLRELGIDVPYDNASGADVKFTPRQLALMGAELMQSPCFAAHSKFTLEEIVHKDGRKTELVNANRMLRSYAGCTGVATGSSQTDGYCGVFYISRGDTNLVCVVLGCKNSATRFAIATEMLNQTFSTIRAQRLATKGDVIAKDVRVIGGKRRDVNLVAKESVVLVLEKNEPALLPVETIPKRLHAPLSAEDVVGTISYQTADGVEKGKVELVVQVPIEEAFLRDFIRNAILGFLRA